LFGIGTPTSTIEEAPTTNNSHAISNNLHISFMKQNLQKKKKKKNYTWIKKKIKL
jgi:hypothetical protein